jgi:DNA-directed RNA polymerase subunit H (RpoH/RPB5)
MDPRQLRTLFSILIRRGYTEPLIRPLGDNPMCEWTSEKTQKNALVFVAPPGTKGTEEFREMLEAHAKPPVTNIIVVTELTDEAKHYRLEYAAGKIEEAAIHIFAKADLSLDLKMSEDQPKHEFVTQEAAGLRSVDKMPIINLEDPVMLHMLAEVGQIVRVSYGHENGAESFNYFRVATTRIKDADLAALRSAPRPCADNLPIAMQNVRLV